MTSVTYFAGGYDPAHPNGNVAERFVNNGDGTGTRIFYDIDGSVASVEELADLPVPEPPQPTAEERIAQLEAVIAALLGGDDE